jgi:hypothetical protein
MEVSMRALYQVQKRAGRLVIVGLLAAWATFSTGASAFAQDVTTTMDPRAPGENVTSVDYSGDSTLPVFDQGSFGDNGPFS